MLDNQSLTNLIEEQITKAVTQQVADILSKPDWLDNIEREIVTTMQDRITKRFANINTIPDLVQAVENSVVVLMEKGMIPDLGRYVDQSRLQHMIDKGIQDLAQKLIDSVILDPAWIEKVENIINQNYAQKFSNHLSQIDLNSLLVTHIDAGVDRWQDRLKKNFQTNGISDQSRDLQLTVMDGVVVVENDLISKNLSIENDVEVKGTLTVQNLALRGGINVDNRAWDELSQHAAKKTLDLISEDWRKTLAQEVLDLAKTQGIEFNNVSVNGRSIIDGNKLNTSIVESSLQKVGILNTLQVSGDAKIHDTLYVSNQRIGINTEAPEMALSVWDEEVSVIAGKLSKGQAYLGTARLHKLSLGINRQAMIEIDTEGLTTIKSLRVGKNRIGHGDQVPGYSGVRGDMVFNTNFNSDQPFGWMCLGGFRWQSLKAS